MVLYVEPNTLTVDLVTTPGAKVWGPDYLTHADRYVVGKASESGSYLDFVDTLYRTWMARAKWNLEKTEGEYLKITPDSVGGLHSEDSKVIGEKLLTTFYPADNESEGEEQESEESGEEEDQA